MKEDMKLPKLRKPRKIYIAGKISGLPRSEVLCNFAAAELYALNQTNAADVSIFNPPFEIDENSCYWRAMAKCIFEVLRADEIYFQRNWLQSRGAKIERAIAELFNKNIYDVIFPGKTQCEKGAAKWLQN